MLIRLISTIQKLKTYTFSVISTKFLSCLLLTAILSFSLIPSAMASSIDKIMEMKGFSKPDDFPLVEDDYYYDNSYYYNNDFNPLEIEDEGEDMILTKINLDKYRFYTFVGDLDKADNDYNCNSLNVEIMDKKGKVLVESEGYTNNPFVQFNPKKSGEYFLASSIPSHYDNESCVYSISEYIGED